MEASLGKYEPLARYLDKRQSDSWSSTFGQIEAELGFPLPSSAYKHRAWWSNQEGPGHSQKEGWQSVGWETREVDLARRTVRFERRRRKDPGAAASGSPSPSDLWDTARRLTGIEDRGELERAALNALIRHEAANALIAMGGTMPDFKPAPRERPFG